MKLNIKIKNRQKFVVSLHVAKPQNKSSKQIWYIILKLNSFKTYFNLLFFLVTSRGYERPLLAGYRSNSAVFIYLKQNTNEPAQQQSELMNK